jgi:hypothetical protein
MYKIIHFLIGGVDMKIGILSFETNKMIDKEISDLNNLLKKKLTYGLRFISFEDPFPLETCKELKKKELIPILTWELFFPDKEENNRRECNPEETHLDELLAGEYDKYIENFAIKAKLWNEILYIRTLHEFNAHWYVWGGYKNGGSRGGVDKVKNSWIYIVNKFKKMGANNVKWLWSVHEPSDFIQMGEWNSIENYWPGDEYVDLMGIDGFNFYPENPERVNPMFKDFDSIFNESYKIMESISEKPIMIMTGTSEFNYEGQVICKSDWIADAFTKIHDKYKKIEIVCWIHLKFNEFANWRIDSSKESLDAFNNNY